MTAFTKGMCEQKDAKRKTMPSGSHTKFTLRLFVSDETVAALEAQLAIEQIKEERSDADFDLKIVDVTKDPEKALTDMVLVTPTLIIDAPPPARRMIGTLRDAAKTLAVLKAS
ncbi:MAG: circadian clock KaiB family protein [Myxococcota bacterium]|nr:circadian clock KaiB family protein [Myxococcota bacterium]